MTEHLPAEQAVADPLVWENGSPANPPLICLHPLAMSGDIFTRAARWLPDRQLLAIDLVGPGEHLGLTIKDMSETVATVIRARNLGPADVVGMSMGGCTALQLALDHPELVRRLVLADTTSSYGPDRIKKWEDRALTAESSAREDLLDFQMTRWFTDTFREREPDECKRAAGIFTRTSPQIHAASARALGQFDVGDSLSEISHPTLVVVGEQDYATPPAMAQVLASRIPNARYHMLPAVKHFSLIESAAAWGLIHTFCQPQLSAYLRPGQ